LPDPSNPSKTINFPLLLFIAYHLNKNEKKYNCEKTSIKS
jgi:hypothetical protein